MLKHAVSCSFVFSLLLSAACGEDDDRRVAVVTSECTSLASCEITETACQRAVLDLTACVRGDAESKLPPIRMLSRADFAAELTEEQEADESIEMRAIEASLEALHLLGPATTLGDASVEQQASAIAAYYRRDEKDITIISDTSMEPDSAMNVLSHELTHYLQDRAGQLLSTSGVSLDEAVALRALTEGDALVTSLHFSAAARGVSPNRVSWDALWSQLEDSVVLDTEGSDSPLMAAAIRLPYLIASPMIQEAWAYGGRAQVDHFYDAPPRTELDWLNGSFAYTLAEPLDCLPPLPPDGYELVTMDSFGVAGLFALLSAGELGQASIAATLGWRQDGLAVYVEKAAADRDELAMLAAWRIRFDNAEAAESFERKLSVLELDVTRAKRELLIRVRHNTDASLNATSCPSRAELAFIPRRPSRSEASLRMKLRVSPPIRF